MYAESLVGAGGDSRGLRVGQHGVHQHGMYQHGGRCY